MMFDLASQQWPLIVIVFGGIAAIVAFGDKLLSLLLKLRDLLRSEPSKIVTEDEVDFLRSFLYVIDDDLLLKHTVRDILDRHADALTREVRSLKESCNWEKILQIRVRVREYFEYSSQYKRAIEFGRAYEAALTATGQESESRWVRVKDAGYMLILDEQYKAGRDEILRVLDEIGSAADDQETVKLRFYAHRYVGISYLRSPEPPDAKAAETFFLSAREAIEAHGITNHTELEARIEGNFGNLYLYLGRIDDALLHFKKSLDLFEEVDDIEHIGIANLQTAQALNRANREGGESHLERAQQLFSRIGWVEGIGRVHFEKALMLRNKAESNVPSNMRTENIKQALREAQIALQTFTGIGSAKWIGRAEQLVSEIAAKSEPYA